MDEDKRVNEDLTNVIASFEKRTQQISEEQREARERFVVALSELSRQYDLLREWTEKNNNELKGFLEKFLEPKTGTELLQELKAIGEKVERIPQTFSSIGTSLEAVEEIAKDFSGQLSELRAVSYHMKDSFNTFLSTFNEGIEKLIKDIKESDSTSLAKQNEISEKLINKISETNTLFQESFTGFQDNLGTIFEKIEKTPSETVEKQLSILVEIQKDAHSLKDEFIGLQDLLKKVNTNIGILNKKQDVISAVIDKRGDGVEEKITLLNEAMTRFTKTYVVNSNQIKTAISELSPTLENRIRTLEKILEDSNNNRKTESEKIIKKLSLFPEKLSKYLDSNKKILEVTKHTQLSIGDISKTIKDLTENIVKKEKKREEKEIVETAQDHLSRGVILFYKGALGAAAKEIRKALELKNDFAEAYLNLGMILGEMGETEKAIESIKKSLEIEPGLEEGYNNLGVVQLRGERYKEAVESFNEAIKLGFKYPRLYLNLAKALFGLDRIDDAVDSLKKVLEIDPTNDEAKELLTTYERGGNHG